MGGSKPLGGRSSGSHMTNKQQKKFLEKQDAAANNAQPTGQRKPNTWNYGGKYGPKKKKGK